MRALSFVVVAAAFVVAGSRCEEPDGAPCDASADCTDDDDNADDADVDRVCVPTDSGAVCVLRPALYPYTPCVDVTDCDAAAFPVETTCRALGGPSLEVQCVCEDIVACTRSGDVYDPTRCGCVPAP